MSLKIKTKLRYGIGLLFAMIVLLGGLSVKNISDMSADTRNILADIIILYSIHAGCWMRWNESIAILRLKPISRKT